MTKRSCPRIASATAVKSLAVVWGEFIDQLCHADPAFDRRIVFELQLGSSFHAQLPREPGLQDRVRRLQADQRLLPLSLRAEDGHEHARMTQIRRRLDAGHGDEPDSRVLQLAHPFGEDLPDRLVHASHALCHPRYSSDWAAHSTLTTSRSARTSSNS